MNQTLTCRRCHRSFNKISNMKQHLLSHLGVRPFRCGVCAKKFSQKGNRDRHQRSNICQ